MQKHPAQMRAHQFLPPLFVATIIVSAAIAPVGTIGRWILALAAGAYAAGNLCSATALLAHKSAWPQAPDLVRCLLHFGYGFGFLTGLVKFQIDGLTEAFANF